MQQALKLKEHLQTNVSKTLLIKKLVGSYPETDFTTKEPTGGTIYLYIFADDTGQEYKHYLSEKDDEIVRSIGVGNKVAVVRTELVKPDGKRVYPISWGEPSSIEMNAAPQMRTNTAEQTQQRKKETYQEEKEAEAVSKIIFGYMNTEMAKGKTPIEAATIAKEAYRMQVMIVSELLAH